MAMPLHIIFLSPWWLVGGVGGLIGAVVLSRLRRRARRRDLGGNPAEPNWSVPAIDRHSGRRSFFHDWDPRLKIASLLLYCFLIVTLRRLELCAAAVGLSIAAMAGSRLPWTDTIRRLKAMSGFLLMFVIVLPLSVPDRAGDTLVVFGHWRQLSLNMSGLVIALRVVLKACAVAMLMDPLFASAPLSVTLGGLARIGVPRVVTEMVLLSHRYIFVFLHEIKRMYRGMLVRGFRPRTSLDTMRVFGNFLGMLFVRSFDRTQRVYEAMLSRGYDGRFPSYHVYEAKSADWWKAGLWLGAGLGLVALDLLWR